MEATLRDHEEKDGVQGLGVAGLTGSALADDRDDWGTEKGKVVSAMARDRKENDEDGEDGVDGVDGVGEEDGSRLWPTGRRTDAVLDYSRTPSKSSQSSARDGRMGLHVPLCKLMALRGPMATVTDERMAPSQNLLTK
ncbi:hypothetical protein NEUTE2DRAFT_124213 [Neurospora tetrasperma FGSC 2509]|nr:hypothetical protein NEUTE2DRAFT_124213 [Neurospora tetrasperma FGSC 2509]